MISITRKYILPTVPCKSSAYILVSHNRKVKGMETISYTTKSNDFIKITEGTATMYYDKKEAVFYNKVQVFNRDISVQVIKLFQSVLQEERNVTYQKKLEKYHSIIEKAVNNEKGDLIKPPRQLEVGITILDALAATGLRSIRYLKEIPNVRTLTINDISLDATNAAMENCKLNQVDLNKVVLNTGDATMLMYMHRNPESQYDVIDLDPYGSATPFLDSAVQSISDGGLLCVTCTDMPVLSGNYPETCYARYGSLAIKGSYLHEMSLRILLHAIDSVANKYERYIVPWISVSVDFYIRVFVRVFESAAEVKESCLKRGMVYQSSQCPSFFVQPLGSVHLSKKSVKTLHVSDTNDSSTLSTSAKIVTAPTTVASATISLTLNEMMDLEHGKSKNGLIFSTSTISVPSKCPETGGNMKIGGPFWIYPIHKQEIVDELLRRVESISSVHPSDSTKDSGRSTSSSSNSGSDNSNSNSSNSNSNCDYDYNHPPSTLMRIMGILTSISEELKDVPFHYNLSDLASTIRVQVPHLLEFNSAIINAGYRVSQFHREPLAIKTDAPNYVIWDIMRAYAKKYPPEVSKHRKFPESGKAILENESTLKSVSFKYVKRLQCATKKRVARFLPNPEDHWGPKRRARKQHPNNDSNDDNNQKQDNSDVDDEDPYSIAQEGSKEDINHDSEDKIEEKDEENMNQV